MHDSIPVDAVLSNSRKAIRPCPYQAGTKQARLFELLRPACGVTVNQLSTFLGWLPHSTRAALTRLRKDGVAVEVLPCPKDSRQMRYRLGQSP